MNRKHLKNMHHANVNETLMVENSIQIKNGITIKVDVSPQVQKNIYCMKSIQIWSFFWSVFSCIWTEYRKIRNRKNSVFGHFSRSEVIAKNS